MIKEMTVNETVEAIKQVRVQHDALAIRLILRAQLQLVTEIDFDNLLQVIREGIEFLESCQKGKVIDEEWISKCDLFFQKVRQYTLDAYEGERKEVSHA